MLGDDVVALDDDELSIWYDEWLRTLSNSPTWSTENPHYVRIPWLRAKPASQSGDSAGAFQAAGCYLLAASPCIPRKIGKTKQPLKKRLFPRYFTGPYCQCMLAEQHGRTLLQHGWRRLPDDVLAWYFRHHSPVKYMAFREAHGDAPDQEIAEHFRQVGGTTSRLEDAADFARHGATGIWFALIPVSNASDASRLEPRLIEVAKRWNAINRLTPLRGVGHM